VFVWVKGAMICASPPSTVNVWSISLMSEDGVRQSWRLTHVWAHAPRLPGYSPKWRFELTASQSRKNQPLWRRPEAGRGWLGN